MSEVKEHPILFSGEMVRAILDGRKTMTRRVVKAGFDCHLCNFVKTAYHPLKNVQTQAYFEFNDMFNDKLAGVRFPYGNIGSHLWVREMWAAPHAYDHIPPRLIPCDASFHFAADEERGGLLWRPSIHMPRWASRITLEITGVRVERLQEVSEEGAVAEGIAPNWCGSMADFLPEQHGWRNYSEDENGDEFMSPVNSFKSLWNSLNAKRGYEWDENPWVWVVAFRRVEV